jgi:predicted AAA+ superfamily ATPase
LLTGGLPGICFFRENRVRAPRFETHLETLLERDIRLLVQTTTSFRQLKLLMTLLASAQGNPINYSLFAKRLGTSPPTVRNLIAAMEGIFLLRTLSTENLAAPVLFFEDQGTASYLLGEDPDPQFDLRRGLFACLLPQFLYRPELVSTFSQYRTRGGAIVDLVIKTVKGTLGVIPVADDQPTPSSLASARSFLANIRSSQVIIAHQGTQLTKMSESLMAVPFQMLISDGWKNH